MLVLFRESGSRGSGVLHNIQWDNFFRDEIVPEENCVLDRSAGGFQTCCCINPFESGIAPIAEARVIYAEFADGSTYGERSEAADISTTRSVILEHLHQLDRAGGNEAFLRLLAQKLKSDEADGCIEKVRSVQKTEAQRRHVDKCAETFAMPPDICVLCKQLVGEGKWMTHSEPQGFLPLPRLRVALVGQRTEALKNCLHVCFLDPVPSERSPSRVLQRVPRKLFEPQSAQDDESGPRLRASRDCAEGTCEAVV